MGRKQSSFHMGNEFNGNGEVRYLKGTQPCIHPPVSQENVQLTPDFGNYLLKVLGSIPVAISPLNINPVLFALLGSMFSVTQVIITKDPVTGNYDFKFKIISPHDFTNGSYPYTFQIMDNQVPAAMGVKNQWVAFGEQWKYLKNGKYLWHCWEMIDGKWYYFHSDEIMASHEWIETNGKWYFVHGNGDMAVNAWIETNDIWYYVGKDGVMYSDVVATIDGERYYFYKTGRLAVLEVIYIPNTGEKYEADGKGVLTPIEDSLTKDEKIFVQTIYGEADACSEAAWEAIANVIMNRIGVREWKKCNTPVEVIKSSGFDAYKNKNDPYKEAENYLINRDYSNSLVERMIHCVIPVYRGETVDTTDGCTLYYSPKTQAALAKKYPSKYKPIPNWDFSNLEEVQVPGTENDDFKFYRYK